MSATSFYFFHITLGEIEIQQTLMMTLLQSHLNIFRVSGEIEIQQTWIAINFVVLIIFVIV